MSAIDHTAYFASRLPWPSGRTRIRSQRPWRAVGAGDADLFLLPLAFARRLEQAKHRLRHIGIADEDPLHRAHVERVRRARERQIGGVGIDHMAARIGDRQSVIGMIGDAAHDRIVGGAVGEANDAGGEGEQVEQPDHRQQRQQPEDIGLGLRTADGHQRDRRRDDPAGHQQHQHDAAAAPRRLVGGHRLSWRIVVRYRRSYQGMQPVDMDVARASTRA